MSHSWVSGVGELVYLSLCVCGGVFVCVHMCVQAHLPMHIYVESRNQHLASVSIVFHLILWDRVSHWSWSSPHQRGCLPRGPRGLACLHLLSAGILTWHAGCCASLWWWIWTQGLSLVPQALSHWANSLASCTRFLAGGRASVYQEM